MVVVDSSFSLIFSLSLLLLIAPSSPDDDEDEDDDEDFDEVNEDLLVIVVLLLMLLLSWTMSSLLPLSADPPTAILMGTAISINAGSTPKSINSHSKSSYNT